MEEKFRNIYKAIQGADALLIGASNGLSISEGYNIFADDTWFQNNFGDFRNKYGIHSVLEGSFYNFPSPEEKWAFFSRLISRKNYLEEPSQMMKNLYGLVKDKTHFVITTNVDGQFETAGFDKKKIFAVQGDYRFLQCENACHNKLYDNQEMVEEWLKYTKDCKIPSHLVPKCPICGGNMEMNLRKDLKLV